MKRLILLAALALATPAFAGKHTVTYQVPAPAALEAHSRFQLDYETEALANGHTRIRYTLPAILLGREREFTLEGRTGGDAFTLAGPDAEMSCALDAEDRDNTVCHVNHREVEVDLEQVHLALLASSFSQEERAGRFALAAFVEREGGGDMVGVMSYVKGLLVPQAYEAPAAK